MIRPSDDNLSASDGSSIDPSTSRGLQQGDGMAAAPAKKSNRRRRVRNILISIAIGLLLAALIAPMVLKAVVRRQLSELAAQNLTGDLHIGSISFALPWGVTLGDVTFTTSGPDGQPMQIFKVPRAMVKLARSPLGSGPLEIADAELDDPRVHLIQTASGIVGVHPDSSPIRPLSQVMLVHHAAVSAGQFMLEDRTEPTSVPTEWRKIDLTLDKSGSGAAEYAFHARGEGASDAAIDTSGHADFDSMVLNVDTCNASVIVHGAVRESGLPTVAQKALAHVGAAGELSIQASGRVPMREAKNSTYHAVVGIKDATLVVSECQTRLDHVAAQFTADAAVDSLHQDVHFASLDAVSDDASLHWEEVGGKLDYSALNWAAHVPNAKLATGSMRRDMAAALRDALENWHLRGTVQFALDASGPLDSGDLHKYRADLQLKPGDLSLQPPEMHTALDRFTETTLRLENASVGVHQLRAMCGDDMVFVRDATIALGELPAKLKIDKAGGAITFGAHHGTYPPRIAQYIDRYNPYGPFFFNGSFSTDSSSSETKLNYDVDVRTTRGRFDLIDRRIPVYNVRGDVHMTPAEVLIKNIDADALGGRLTGSGNVKTADKPAYDLQISGNGLDLRELALRMATPGHAASPVSGRARLNVQCMGSIPENGSVLDQLKGSGTFDIRQADLFEVPVLKEIAGKAGSKEAAIVSDAGAQFHVVDKKIFFDRALISAPALGVEGTGTVDFDGKVEFHKVVALAGGDWQRNAGGENPAGEVFGKIQGALNNATRAVWVDLDVTGTVNDPVVKATPVPFLTRPMLHVKELLGSDK